MSIDLVMTYTSKKAFSQEDYRIYDQHIKSFKDIKEAKDFLKSEFYYCKTKKPMYVDKNDGTTVKCGEIYCYNEKGYDRNKAYYMNVQVWVAWYEVHTKAIDFNAMNKKPNFRKDFQEVYNTSTEDSQASL